eukprot:TRINITY_DN54261_c0_g1_i1.p1 TRINITY_DN54261_c0_g1~~TRINITY_DN54261_c0_g1_i1.p1  ORF type:complete len:495 (-),score=97.51 TRINITY_DN54261_c0_g1_i1:31-1347(-)
MVVRALFRGGKADHVWKLLSRLEALDVDPGISALGVLLHQSRHKHPNLMHEMEATSALARLRPCRHLQIAILNAAMMRLEEQGEPEIAHDLAEQLASNDAADTVTQQVARRLAECVTGSAMLTARLHWTMPTRVRGHACCDYDKQCKLLQHVLATASPGCPQSIIESIESFSVDGNGWLNIAGGAKGVVLDDLVQVLAPQPVQLILEFGCFVGYSSTRMASLCHHKGGRVVTVEVDPVHACIARNVHEYAGIADAITVCIGYSEDVIPHLRETCGGLTANAVLMDQRGTRFHIDLQMLERHCMLKEGCAVLADNVLKPGAPHFLWYLQTSPIYDLTVVSLREFAADRIEDWMALGRYWPGRASGAQASAVEAPKALENLAFLTDKARARSCNADGPCEVDEDAWARHSQQIRCEYEKVGIRPRIVHVQRQNGKPFVSW